VTLTIRSPAWPSGGPIPAKYTADGQNISPPLVFEGIPSGAQALALICDDPDAPLFTFVHWVLYDLPASATGLAEAVPAQPTLADGSRHGTNGWKKLGYGGPSPPGHKPHRYYFRLYALREPTRAEPGLSAKNLSRAIQDRTVESAEYVGTYARP
jgi:Raf kinase inhibitor-like YbhB/YbcL family protein